MALYFITYELRNKEKNYSTFYDSIKGIATDSCQCLTNAWLICSSSEIHEIYSKLKPLLEDTDNLLMGEIEYNKLAGWVSSDTIDFLKRNNS